MPDGLNPEERRGYLAGIVAARLDGHDEHFREINGQIGELAVNTAANGRKLDRVLDEMPRVLTIAQEAEKAKVVAATLAKKTDDERGTWERYKNWAVAVVGIIVSLAALTTFVRGFNPPDAPPAQTVTVPDITPSVYP